MDIFEQLESSVRAYCRDFPTIFKRAKGYRVWDDAGREYIDFFAGAGALNYGHNDETMKRRLIEYIDADGIAHGLDMATEAKARFLERFRDVILQPRQMPHKVMFPGPTGTNAVESALKLARKVTGRESVISFTNAFHGMTLGALSVTGNAFKRSGAGVPLNHGTVMPFAGYMHDDLDTLAYMERILDDQGSGVDLPAAVIVETLQGEGGLNTASTRWLKGLEDLCRSHDMLLIVDDIQAGCGRTGPFFSFEPAGISPDIVCLSKSIGGYGLPMALTLIKPKYDVFDPGEHNGTFRGNNLAFVTATTALDFWIDDRLETSTLAKGQKLNRFLSQLVEKYPALEGEVRGRGLMQGIAVGPQGLAKKICRNAFEQGLIMETSGPSSAVAKVMPPLIIDDVGLEKGLHILGKAVKTAVAEHKNAAKDVA